MALVTDYASLQAHVADTLNRSDLTSVIPNFIQQAEAGLKRDTRCRDHVELSPFTVSADGAALPTGLIEIDSLYHDGASFHTPIEIVATGDVIAELKQRYYAAGTGVPEFAAVVDGTLRFAPTPDAAYDLKLAYWRTVSNLSDSNTSNWLLTDHPDIYLYAALVEAELYLKNPESASIWSSVLDNRLDDLADLIERKQIGGMIRRTYEPIGD